jgi:agmatine deiminase
LERADLVLEGGSIETDGYGTLLTTTSCLLSPNRNRLDRATLEQKLQALLGVRRFLWLNQGYLAGDDTDGHIDTLARFCNARTIAYQTCDDSDDAHFAALASMQERLTQFSTANGDRYRLVPLPWPSAKLDDEGKRLPASYANFLIINGAVLVPTYDDPADSEALERLQGCFPEREIVGIPCLTLIRQGGSLHCITMQLPEGVLPDW